jgi:hypothetical protein
MDIADVDARVAGLRRADSGAESGADCAESGGAGAESVVIFLRAALTVPSSTPIS